jgi:hypothetical protein
MGSPQRRVPLAVKLVFTLFMCVLVPFYWRAYGPTNFLYFCDLALFLTLAALWLESPLLASMPAVGILLPQVIWVVDFFSGLLFGKCPLGLTAYMFDGVNNPLEARALSTFHGWLPFLLLWLVWRIGYDTRAFLAQTVLVWSVLLICFFFTPPPPPPEDHRSLPVNINYVFAYPWDESKPQQAMPPAAWLGIQMAFHFICILLPTHFLLRKYLRRA